jgi:hypothetical protein
MSETVQGEPSAPVVEVEFRTRNSAYPFVGISEEEACRMALARLLPRGDGEYAEVFDVAGADTSRVLARAGGYEAVDVSLLAEYDRGGLFELTVTEDCPALRLAELGALPQRVEGAEGQGRIVTEVPPQRDATTVVETFLDDYPGVTLASKRGKESVTPLVPRAAVARVLRTCLTDRQREVIETAFEAGYYDWPREATGQEVAADLGISSATFSEHVHAAERKLLTVLFEGPRSGRLEES